MEKRDVVVYSEDYKKLVDATALKTNITRLTNVSRKFAKRHSKVATSWKRLSCQRN